METKEIEFSKLRHAYIVVKNFIESESFEKIKNLNTKLEEDLYLSGDDNYELLVKFVEKFELDYENFDYSKHFLSEGELFNSTTAFLNLLNLSIWLPLKTIELLTFNKIKLEKPNFGEPEKKLLDLSFKDLITWYIEKEYKLSSEIIYKIKPELN